MTLTACHFCGRMVDPDTLSVFTTVEALDGNYPLAAIEQGRPLIDDVFDPSLVVFPELLCEFCVQDFREAMEG